MISPMMINYLAENGHLDQVYEVLDDPADVVVNLMSVMNKTETMPQCVKDFKSESISSMYRGEGNEAYKAKHFRIALESYNKSLCYAPINSTAMKLAYGNRSALLYTVKAYSACIKDIDMIFSMGCTDHDLVKRLRIRKLECQKMAWRSEFKINMLKNGFAGKFFNFDVRRHPEIPCASTDINVVMESGLPKVVAARDIEAGTLVSLESPFVSELHPTNYWVSCHYCHKFTLNLIPCNGCCATLFCDETCMKKCFTEFHNIECQIMSCFQKDTTEFGNRMKIKAALKIKQKCKTWKELITASFNIGEDRMRNSCVSDIYNEKSKFSILSFDNNLHFVHGKTVSSGLLCAIELHHLRKIPNFWPKCKDEKEAAVRAIARIMMKLRMYYPKIGILNPYKEVSSENIVGVGDGLNHGWFAFTSKLKHSCDANLLALGLKDNIALLTLRPIQQGSELNISYLGHYYEQFPRDRHLFLFTYGLLPICSCRVCAENWTVVKGQKLSSKEMELYKKCISNTQNMRFVDEVDQDVKVFKATCKVLAQFQNLAGTPEHKHIFVELRRFLSVCQYATTGNTCLQK